MLEESEFRRWAELHDSWFERDFVALCCGLMPDGGRPNTEELNQAAAAIKAAVLAGTLKSIPDPSASAGDVVYGSARSFLPTDAIAWAAPRFPKFPYRETPTQAEEGLQDGGGANPLGKRERDTLLNIIAAFCKFEGYDLKERGLAARIAQMTQDLGAPVSDDTIRAVLAQIPDALESRMK
jgi:hypothetical protein